MVSVARESMERALPWPLAPLIASMAEAARRNDRETYDELFDCCFGWVYSVALRVTHDAARAEAVTAYVLREAVIEAE
jgi:hypothetical protein